MTKHNDRRVKIPQDGYRRQVDFFLFLNLHCWHVKIEGLPLFELGGLLLVIVFVVVEFISVRSIRTIVTMRRLQQDLKV